MQKTSALALKESIAHLAFPLTPTSTPLRRSSRHSGSIKVDIKESSLSPLLDRSDRKRKVLDDEPDTEGPSPKSRPKKRGYADPETYAHLKALDDHLAPNLDVIFCGINPGEKSAKSRHHFANPTNHFWRCLHRSGFTPRCLPPGEDFSLPSQYNLGLTNLVERPSVEQAELSREEMIQSVPTLKAKIIGFRPRIVCFVGKGIWLITESVFKAQISVMSTDNCDTKVLSLTPSLAPGAKRKSKKTAGKTFYWGLQPYKFVYPDGGDEAIKVEDADASFMAELAGGTSSRALASGTLGAVRETLFFVMPSTSGRVVSHQLDDKVKLFARLLEDLEKAKSGTLDTTSMVTIPLDKALK